MSTIKELLEYVQKLPRGKITGADEYVVRDMLYDCWRFLRGSRVTSMDRVKLHRMENLAFTPPYTLTFEIERHGATTMGSHYAHVYEWTVHLHEGTVECNPQAKKRMVAPPAARLNVVPLAEEVVMHIINGNRESELLQWKSENKVKVKIADIIPATYKQTTTSRRRRFRNKLEELLKAQGWYPTAAYNVYERKG